MYPPVEWHAKLLVTDTPKRFHYAIDRVVREKDAFRIFISDLWGMQLDYPNVKIGEDIERMIWEDSIDPNELIIEVSNAKRCAWPDDSESIDYLGDQHIPRFLLPDEIEMTVKVGRLDWEHCDEWLITRGLRYFVPDEYRTLEDIVVKKEELERLDDPDHIYSVLKTKMHLRVSLYLARKQIFNKILHLRVLSERDVEY